MTDFDGIERQTGTAPTWAVIWLHGLGADGHDFDPIVPELVQRDWPAIRFIFPHAPVQPVTINGGARMRSWYDIFGADLNVRQDEAGIRASAAFTDTLVAREIARGIASERILLAGFSQGGAIVLTAGLRQRARLGGIIALSTYLPLAWTLEAEAASANRKTPIFMAHGSMDPIIPIPRAESSRDALGALGYPVQWHRYPMPHAVCAEEIRDLAQWMQARFAVDSAPSSARLPTAP